MCGCGMDAILLFFSVLFNLSIFIFMLPVLLLLYYCVLTSLYCYSLCLDVFSWGIITTSVCIGHSYACTTAVERAVLFGYWFPPHSPSLAGYIFSMVMLGTVLRLSLYN